MLIKKVSWIRLSTLNSINLFRTSTPEMDLKLAAPIGFQNFKIGVHDFFSK